MWDGTEMGRPVPSTKIRGVCIHMRNAGRTVRTGFITACAGSTNTESVTFGNIEGLLFTKQALIISGW